MKNLLAMLLLATASGAFTQTTGVTSYTDGNRSVYSNGVTSYVDGNRSVYSNGVTSYVDGKRTVYSNKVTSYVDGNRSVYSNGFPAQESKPVVSVQQVDPVAAQEAWEKRQAGRLYRQQVRSIAECRRDAVRKWKECMHDELWAHWFERKREHVLQRASNRNFSNFDSPPRAREIDEIAKQDVAELEKWVTALLADGKVEGIAVFLGGATDAEIQAAALAKFPDHAEMRIWFWGTARLFGAEQDMLNTLAKYSLNK